MQDSMDSTETNCVLQLMHSDPGSALAMLEQMERELANFDRLRDYKPYPKQAEFHAAGIKYRERMLMAGNQLGKTLAAAMETAMHLTGRYPDDWKGKRFDRPVRGIAGSESSELTRKGVQRLLLGNPENPSEWGSGAIPKECLEDTTRKSGVPDAVASITVRSEFGGISSVQFQSYDQGRTKWQADTLDFAWMDEEPPEDIYYETLTRTNTTMGPVYVTLTPLLGATTVVNRFWEERPAGTHLTIMTIDDVEHYTPEQRAAIIATYPEYERDARTRGIPQLGSGRVFPISEEDITVAPFAIPSHWPQVCGIDFGWDHPSAAARLAWDRDSDCLYVMACHRQREQTPAMFAASIRPWGDWLPWSWPHDGLQHDKGSGEQLAGQYRAQGLKMLPVRATFEDGTFGVEAGIAEMLDRMETGRLKVFSTCQAWFEEFRLYHRKDGLIVKLRDDLISATRYGMMMKRHAVVQYRQVQPKPGRSFSGRGSDQGWMSS
jgi:phage terminase large subunit-like protein